MKFFERKLNFLHTFTYATTTNEKALLVSYGFAFHIAKTSKTHKIAEELILPAAVENKTVKLNNTTVQ